MQQAHTCSDHLRALQQHCFSSMGMSLESQPGDQPGPRGASRSGCLSPWPFSATRSLQQRMLFRASWAISTLCLLPGHSVRHSLLEAPAVCWSAWVGTIFLPARTAIQSQKLSSGTLAGAGPSRRWARDRPGRSVAAHCRVAFNTAAESAAASVAASAAAPSGPPHICQQARLSASLCYIVAFAGGERLAVRPLSAHALARACSREHCVRGARAGRGGYGTPRPPPSS